MDNGGELVSIAKEDIDAVALLAVLVARDLDTGKVAEAIRGAKLVHALLAHLGSGAAKGHALNAWEQGVSLGDRVAPALARARRMEHAPGCTYVEQLESALRYAVLEQRRHAEEGRAHEHN